MFLFDGDRQLKIRFNPSVSGIKNTILESKSDTIGGKYPYFFRNGHVNYKEFNISGLLTHLTDNDGYFETALAQKKFDDNTLSYGKGRYDVQLNPENFAMERVFKLEVLDWLTDGKPKLFRSPAEGNYIVKLMNVSLSPIETVGRMIHSFDCSACEMKEYNHKNLIDLGIIKDNLLIGINKIVTSWGGSEELKVLSLSENYLDTLGIDKAIGVVFYPVGTNDIWVKINGSDVNIQLSQNFSNVVITSLKASEKQTQGYDGMGSFTIKYEREDIPSINNSISSVDRIDIPIIQFCGVKDIYSDINAPVNLLNRFLSKDKEYLSQIFLIKAVRREIIWTTTENESDWSSLLGFVSKEPIVEEVNKLYAVYDQNDILLGYKDKDTIIRLSDWVSLKGLSDSEKYLLKFTDKEGKITTKTVRASGLILTPDDMNFDEIDSLVSNLFLDVVISCRLGSKTFFDESDYSQYNIWLTQFQNGMYTTQEALETLLSNIQTFWKEGVLDT